MSTKLEANNHQFETNMALDFLACMIIPIIFAITLWVVLNIADKIIKLVALIGLISILLISSYIGLYRKYFTEESFNRLYNFYLKKESLHSIGIYIFFILFCILNFLILLILRHAIQHRKKLDDENRITRLQFDEPGTNKQTKIHLFDDGDEASSPNNPYGQLTYETKDDSIWSKIGRNATFLMSLAIISIFTILMFIICIHSSFAGSDVLKLLKDARYLFLSEIAMHITLLLTYSIETIISIFR